MKIDEVIQTSLLYDFYGSLLTDRQREVMELYYGENLSLSEIAAEFSISRQGVHDALKNAEKGLHEYEQKLGLVEKFQQSREAVGAIDEMIEELMEAMQKPEPEALSPEEVTAQLRKIKEIIDKLEE